MSFDMEFIVSWSSLEWTKHLNRAWCLSCPRWSQSSRFGKTIILCSMSHFVMIQYDLMRWSHFKINCVDHTNCFNHPILSYCSVAVAQQTIKETNHSFWDGFYFQPLLKTLHTKLPKLRLRPGPSYIYKTKMRIESY